MRSALAAVLLAASPALAAGPLETAAIRVGADRFVVGRAAPSPDLLLDCVVSTVQHTVKRCSLKSDALSRATAFGRPVKSATLNLHFQGAVLNMSVEFDASPETLIADARAAFGRAPKVQYWADDAHLYEASIWIDEADQAEVEIDRAIKGAKDSGARVYMSSLAGGRPLHPDDAP